MLGSSRNIDRAELSGRKHAVRWPPGPGVVRGISPYADFFLLSLLKFGRACRTAIRRLNLKSTLVVGTPAYRAALKYLVSASNLDVIDPASSEDDLVVAYDGQVSDMHICVMSDTGVV